jgi:hypothetical protein
LARSRAPERLPKRDLHCLRRSRVCKAPAASRSTGYPACGGTRDTGGPFFGSFLWASKEMNIMIPMLPLAPFPNFNYVAQARIHHRRKAANDDNLITLASR